jgi:hypothetical protein
MLSAPRKRMGAKLARCPGCGAARNEVERCAADPGPPRTVTIPGLQRTTSLRLCCAAPGTRSKLSPYTPSRGTTPINACRASQPIANKSLARRIFLLTGVTRIFQKNVLTKTAPAGQTPLRVFVARMSPQGHAVRATKPVRFCATSGCRRGPAAPLPCFRPVLYREPCNFNVSPEFARLLQATAPAAPDGRRQADRPS